MGRIKYWRDADGAESLILSRVNFLPRLLAVGLLMLNPVHPSILLILLGGCVGS